MFSLYSGPSYLPRYFPILMFCTSVSIIGNSQTFSLSNNFKEDTAKINQLDRLAKKQSNPDSIIILYMQMQKLSMQIPYPDGVASALMGIGLLNSDLGNYQQALDYFKQAYPFCQKAKYDKALLPLCYNNIALVYSYQSEYVLASQNYHKALQEINRSYKTPPSLSALIFNNLATIQITLKQYDKALAYLTQGENIARNGDFPKRLAMILGNKGIYYSNLNKLDSARKYFNEAIAIGRKINDPKIQAACTINIGDIFIKAKQNEKAIPYYLEAISISQKNEIPYSKIIASYSLGEAYNNLKKYPEAEAILRLALNQAMTIKMRVDIVMAYTTLASVYKATHQYAKASAIQDTLLVLKDSLMSTEKTKAINNLEIRYRTAEKDKQLAVRGLQLAQQERNIAKKNLQIGGVSAGAIILSMSMIWLYRRERYKESLQKEQIRTLQHEQEIGQLKAMVRGEEKERARIASDLHDSIVGQLAAIRMNFSAIQHEHNLEHLNDYEEALQQLSDASDDVRKTAHNLMPAVLLQGGLNAAVDHYCRKMSKGLELNFQHFGELPKMDPDLELSAYRIVQELVQNVIKHAQASKALVQINYRNGTLSLTVEDNGKGMKTEPENETGTTGFGLKNLATRVKAFNGHMEVESQEGNGTTVYVEFEVG